MYQTAMKTAERSDLFGCHNNVCGLFLYPPAFIAAIAAISDYAYIGTTPFCSCPQTANRRHALSTAAVINSHYLTEQAYRY